MSLHLLVICKFLLTFLAFHLFFLGVDTVMSFYIPGIPVTVSAAWVLTFKQFASVDDLMGDEFCFAFKVSTTIILLCNATVFLHHASLCVCPGRSGMHTFCHRCHIETHDPIYGCICVAGGYRALETSVYSLGK